MIIRFIPLAFTKVWGGENLSKMFKINQEKIGEIWGISAHESASTLIKDGKFKGLTLRELYNQERVLFGNLEKDEFPVLIKIIDASQDLSVQVHPTDNYAKEYYNSLGKDECWYILDCKEGAEIIIGHHAKTKEELMTMVESKDYDKLLNRFRIYPKDYFYLPSGKVHAICKDTTVLEVSQSSNLTFRLYDYDRLDNGKLRDLHVEESLAVIDVPDEPLKRAHLNKYFHFEVKENQGLTKVKADKHGDYLYIITGEGLINGEKLIAKEFLMVSSGFEYEISGDLKYSLIRIF